MEKRGRLKKQDNEICENKNSFWGGGEYFKENLRIFQLIF